jgi:hypothetical protein
MYAFEYLIFPPVIIQNKDSGTCNMTESIVNEKVLSFPLFYLMLQQIVLAVEKITISL